MSNYEFVLGYLLRKNLFPREIHTLMLAGAIKRGQKGGNQILATFHPMVIINYFVHNYRKLGYKHQIINLFAAYAVCMDMGISREKGEGGRGVFLRVQNACRNKNIA